MVRPRCLQVQSSPRAVLLLTTTPGAPEASAHPFSQAHQSPNPLGSTYFKNRFHESLRLCHLSEVFAF